MLCIPNKFELTGYIFFVVNSIICGYSVVLFVSKCQNDIKKACTIATYHVLYKWTHTHKHMHFRTHHVYLYLSHLHDTSHSTQTIHRSSTRTLHIRKWTTEHNYDRILNDLNSTPFPTPTALRIPVDITLCMLWTRAYLHT